MGKRVGGSLEMGFDDDLPVVLYVGALVEEKGVDLAISAVAEVDGANLVIAGGGVERQRLEDMASKLMPGRCSFHWLCLELCAALSDV